MQLPKWRQGDFFSAIHTFQLKYEGDKSRLPEIRTVQEEKYKTEIEQFNKYKGETLNQLIDIERKLDCIIIDYFVPSDYEHQKDDFYQNMIIESRLEFMQKKVIVKNIYNKTFSEYYKVTENPQFKGKPNEEQLNIEAHRTKQKKLDKPFTMLGRIIEFRNVLAHSYFDYELLHSEPISGVIKNQSKSNDQIIFDKEFQNETIRQFVFIDYMLNYIFEVLLKQKIRYHIYSAFHTFMGLETGEYGKAELPAEEGDIKDYLNKLMGQNYGVNRYFR